VFSDTVSDTTAESDADISDDGSDSGLGFVIVTAVFRPLASVAAASK